ncbi:hypothetical protein O1611_g467 [Lasiodiplodia mahajangana]|uniref:Uncharacterized protein n=1 Tax=Lasiodiplodia mahajangana TaxID=1108764 RepID=A0ACC2K0S8_9PEZI|nr:hypothetical protein O1611_g467 [Lasiodiplodia mahajangana]
MRNLVGGMATMIRNSNPDGVDDYAMGRIILDEICVQGPREAAATRSWKSSTLAILFCSLDEVICQRTELTWFRDEIDDIARTTSAQLAHDGAVKAKFSED